MARQFTNHFEAAQWYDSQMSKCEAQIRTLMSTYEDLKKSRDWNKRQLEQERIQNR